MWGEGVFGDEFVTADVDRDGPQRFEGVDDLLEAQPARGGEVASDRKGREHHGQVGLDRVSR